MQARDALRKQREAAAASGGGPGGRGGGMRGGGAATAFLKASIRKQLKVIQAAHPAGPAAAAPPGASPADQRDNEQILAEVRDDAVRLLLRGVQRTVATTPDKAAAIGESPAVHTLIRRSTGWIGRLPDQAKLLVCVLGKLAS